MDNLDMHLWDNMAKSSLGHKWSQETDLSLNPRSHMINFNWRSEGCYILIISGLPWP